MTLAAIWRVAFPALTWLLAAGWLRRAWEWHRHLPEVADLTRLPVERDQDGAEPRVTVVVPACNEQAAIEATLRSLLRSEGVQLEIIAIDDRSTDATGAIMDRVAADRTAADCAAAASAGAFGPHSLTVLHVRELPPGWLGKPHALAMAAERSQTDWILFTDGDVLFAPRTIAMALAYAHRERADHLVLMPDWLLRTHGEAAMHGALHALSTWTLRLWRVADPKAKDFLGVGAFNLVRREVYQALGGFTALRMEVLEDLRLAWKLKRAGYRQRVALGPGLAAVRWSNGAWGVVKNLEKNLFALYRYRVPMMLLACFGLVVQIVWPLAAIGIGLKEAGGVAALTLAGGMVIYAAVGLVFVVCRKVTMVPARYMLLYPAAISLFLFAMVRSMVLALLRGGVTWRGTLYSLKELRAHAGPFWSGSE